MKTINLSILLIFFLAINQSYSQGVVGGNGVVATGASSTAIGYQTQALGIASFAGGWQAIAQGDGSFSFGDLSYSKMDYAISLGFGTKAYRPYSISIGYNAISGTSQLPYYGDYAIAIGSESQAIGNYSMALGSFVKASGTNGIVIGKGVSASQLLNSTNTNSLAVGFNSTIPTLFVGSSSGANTTGNIGIATTIPGSKLQVNGNAAIGYSNTTNAPANGLAVNGNVGIGLTSTNCKLQVNGNTAIGYNSTTRAPENGLAVSGSVCIGTLTPEGALTVKGKIVSEEIEVKDVAADFVFEENYPLMSLTELESFINQHKHLPNVAPAVETMKGVELGDFSQMLLQKIEELTLYIIELKKENEKIKTQLLQN